MDNSVEIYRMLEKEFQSTALHRPMRIERYEAGTELDYLVTSVDTASQAKVRLVIDKFIRFDTLDIFSAPQFAPITPIPQPFAILSTPILGSVLYWTNQKINLYKVKVFRRMKNRDMIQRYHAEAVNSGMDKTENLSRQ